MSRSILYLLVGGLLVAAAGVALFVAFGRQTDAGEGLAIVYPPDEALFPPDIVAPTFRWTDATEGVTCWRITLSFPDGRPDMSFLSRSRYCKDWTPSDAEWAAIKRRSLAKAAKVTIRGMRSAASAEVLSEASVTLSTSTDEVGAPLFFREVNLPFLEAVTDPSNIRWRFGSISSKAPPPVVLGNLPVCGNCHSFSSDGRTLGMEVDSGNDKGAYAVLTVARRMTLGDDTVISWSDYERESGEPTFGLLCQVSPDGRYVAGTVKDQALAVYRSDLMFSQIFFLIKGITAIYDRRAKTFAPLPGADDKRFVQTNATWSPDGKHLVFARSKGYDLEVFRRQRKALVGGEEAERFIRGDGRTFLYDLYRVPFNGGRGGKAEPLEGASNNGMSNYFAKYSPDGRWIVFCKARSYMLLQPDSALYIVPAEGGKARRMRCNTHRLNSWHSWSPNGRWLAFSSKANGPYTQLWLTHVDEQGRDTPPVVLDRMTVPHRAANIPEFVNCAPDAISKISEQYLDDVSYVRAGNEFDRAGQFDRAERAYRRALTFNPKNEKAHYCLGRALSAQGKHDEAMACHAEAIKCKPDFSRAYIELGRLLAGKGDVEQAKAHFTKAIDCDPDNAEAYNNLGAMWLIQGDIERAIQLYQGALKLEPEHALAHRNLGAALLKQGNLKEAKVHLEKALALQDGRDANLRADLASLLLSEGDTAGAIGHLETAVQHSPNNPFVLSDLAWLLATSSQNEFRHGSRAVQLAQRACQATGRGHPVFLDALAAAYAEVGQFPDAVREAEAALRAARAAEMTPLAAEIQRRLELYKQGRPFRK